MAIFCVFLCYFDYFRFPVDREYRLQVTKMSTLTVIHVKYIERNVVEGEESGIETSAVKQAAGNVNESGNKELMVNIDCPIGIILDYIRRIASLEGEIDLYDETNNQLKNVSSSPGWTLGTEILASGAVYLIVKIERDPESGRIYRILPMVAGPRSSKIAADIMSRIQAPRAGASRNRSTSLTGKINLEKMIGGKNNHQEKRNKLGKPASRAKEGQGR